MCCQERKCTSDDKTRLFHLISFHFLQFLFNFLPFHFVLNLNDANQYYSFLFFRIYCEQQSAECTPGPTGSVYKSSRKHLEFNQNLKVTLSLACE